VIFGTGVLSAFLVNDVVCLVMTPFVIELARRLGRERLPYVLAVATSSIRTGASLSSSSGSSSLSEAPNGPGWSAACCIP
jgi:Na+/H+ antiporter NhaD/arsenite permease-like protein